MPAAVGVVRDPDRLGVVFSGRPNLMRLLFRLLRWLLRRLLLHEGADNDGRQGVTRRCQKSHCFVSVSIFNSARTIIVRHRYAGLIRT
ncbi:hypothetical protein [Paraburkholderia bryophila]|uniref:hypothetical protein n=1 Tax=Paraburkholderia bryophila TaxID=420952 RepID=UPI003AF10AF5